MADESIAQFYTNVVRISGQSFDVVFDFGFKAPEVSDSADEPEFPIVARVVMSLSHAKSMLPLMAKIIATYEEEFGPLPAPGFGQSSRE
jgi:Protein of unknown function (DUF3467)